jgi:hypothetical protein
VRRALVLLVVLGGVASADKAKDGDKAKEKTKQIERDGFLLTVPDAWEPLPDVANDVANNLLGESMAVTGGAAAWGDKNDGIFVIAIWAESKEKTKVVRPELEAFHDSLRQSLEQSGGLTIDLWQLSETETRLSSRMAGGNAKLKLWGAATAGIQKKDGALRGWTVVCAGASSRAKKATARCKQVIDSFAVTIADADLKKLEKKGK